MVSSQDQSPLHRLVRTLSGRSTDNLVVSPKAPNNTPAVPLTTLPPLQRTISTTSSQKRRLSVGDRLRKLGKDVAKITTFTKPKSPNPDPTVDDTVATAQPPSRHAKLLSMVAEGEEGGPVDGGAGSSTPGQLNDDQVSPDDLAKRLQQIIDDLPFPAPGDRRTKPIIKPPKPPAKDKTGRPIPPADSTPIKDSKLIKLLSSATFMNGSRDGSRPSIWSVLEGVGAPPHAYPPVEGERPPPGDGGDHETHGGGEEDEPDVFSDNSSVMVYSPLIPSKEDLVELAELVAVAEEEEPVTPSAGAAGWVSMWPLSVLYPTPPASAAEGSSSARANPAVLAGDAVVSRPVMSTNGSGNKVKVRTVRAWVPSKDKLSLQAMWWGYRLYLPPPVLDVLSDKTIEATKRAAMLTTALTWFFNNLPINSLPITIRPTLILLQRIAPYLGYIGTFISWSWSTVKSYDVGFGVTLTATWILPIALIPGTWQEYDFPKSPEPAAPAPLPPANDPAPDSGSGSGSGPDAPPPSPSPPADAPTTTPAPPDQPPIASDPVEPPPVPPEVPPNSPLARRLLGGPFMKNVPLPTVDGETPAPEEEATTKDAKVEVKKKSGGFKAFFTKG